MQVVRCWRGLDFFWQRTVNKYGEVLRKKFPENDSLMSERVLWASAYLNIKTKKIPTRPHSRSLSSSHPMNLLIYEEEGVRGDCWSSWGRLRRISANAGKVKKQVRRISGKKDERDKYYDRPSGKLPAIRASSAKDRRVGPEGADMGAPSSFLSADSECLELSGHIITLIVLGVVEARSPYLRLKVNLLLHR